MFDTRESVRWILRCYQILGASILDAEDRSKIPGDRVWDFYSPVPETGVYSRSRPPPSKMWVMHGLWPGGPMEHPREPTPASTEPNHAERCSDTWLSWPETCVCTCRRSRYPFFIFAC